MSHFSWREIFVGNKVEPVYAPGGVIEGTCPSDALLTDELCMFVFDVVFAHLKGQPLPPLPPQFNGNYQAPLFVTFEEIATHNLRGCIGSLDTLSLSPGLQNYAIKAAFEDHRFSPITAKEIPQLDCKVSLLHTFEKCKVGQCYDWILGTHGIIIDFTDDRGRHFNATYLPEVPLEHNMTRESAIRELTNKAGYYGPLTPAILKKIAVTRYQSGRVKMTSGVYFARRGMNDKGEFVASGNVGVPDHHLGGASWEQQDNQLQNPNAWLTASQTG